MLNNFNVPKNERRNDSPLHNCSYYNKMKGNVMHATFCCFGINQHNNCVLNSALLNLVFTNINGMFLH
jgi:hypothetical protein